MASKAAARGLNVDLKRIECPAWRPDVTANINNSQTLFYRLATILFVKLPAPVLRMFGKNKDAALVENVLFNGDYVRPIATQGNIGDAVKSFPNVENYQGDVSLCAIEKLSRETHPPYRPRNIMLS